MSRLTAIYDTLLSGVSSMLAPEGHIAEQLFPKVQAKQWTGNLAKYGHSHLRIEHSLAGGRGAFRRVEPITRSTTGYAIEKHGLEGMVTEADYDNVQDPYKAEADEVLGLTAHIQNEKEYALATALSSTGNLTRNTTLSGTDQFSDPLNSSPLDVASTARASVRTGCGKVPNIGWCDWAVANKLRYHPQLLKELGFTQARPGGLSDDELAKAFGVERFLVASPVYNSAKEGATDVLGAIWGKHLWFAVLPKSAQVQQVSLGYEVRLEGRGIRQVTKRDAGNPTGATLITCEDAYDWLISNADAAYLIKDAIA